MKPFEHFLEKAQSFEPLTQAEAIQCFECIFEGEVSDDAIAQYLSASRTKDLSSSELKGYVDYLSRVSTPCKLDAEFVFDVCGTGGDGKNTINISTLSALLLASLGEKVAKHGNYSASSSVGSSNLLEALGIPLVQSEAQAQEIFSRAGIVFLHAPFWHPKMKRVAPIRKSLGFRTVFNLLGPLLNPTKPDFQLVGTPDQKIAELLREVLCARDNLKDFAVIHDENGYDEISLTGSANLIRKATIQSVSPTNFGSQVLDPKSLALPSTLTETVELSENILKGKGTEAHMAAIAANTSVALSLRYPQRSLGDLYSSAKERLASGQVIKIVERLRAAA